MQCECASRCYSRKIKTVLIDIWTLSCLYQFGSLSGLTEISFNETGLASGFIPRRGKISLRLLSYTPLFFDYSNTSESEQFIQLNQIHSHLIDILQQRRQECYLPCVIFGTQLPDNPPTCGEQLIQFVLPILQSKSFRTKTDGKKYRKKTIVQEGILTLA